MKVRFTRRSRLETQTDPKFQGMLCPQLNGLLGFKNRYVKKSARQTLIQIM